jgi:predicted phage baseplate assembly protein
MTLQPLQLDDLNWRTMIDAIRGRIAAASDEAWTLHAAVDPGVTLLELFAYLLEQRVYWLDQVPDALVNGLIALLDAERRPAIAATTLLEVTQATGDSLASGTVFQVADGDRTQRVATSDDLALLAVAAIEVAGSFGTRRAAPAPLPRWAFQPLTLLPADDQAAEVRITFWLAQPPVPGSTGLLLEIDDPAAIPPGWATDAVADVAPPATLEWAYSAAGPEGRKGFPSGAVGDGTQSLRRRGVVRIDIPADWAPAGPAADGLAPYALWLRTKRASFSAPPRLHRIIPNVAAARHAIPVAVDAADLDAQIDRWLPLPGLALALPDPLPPLEELVALRLRGRDGIWRDWVPTWDFARHAPEDAVVLVDRVFNCLRFGNGLTGRVPVPSRQPGPKAELHYLAGGGPAGNLGSGLAWECFAPVADAVNPVAVSGGAETESADEARDRIGAELLERHRAVTVPDYEALACATPGVGVARAKAVPGFHPSFPCVNVPGAVGLFVVPTVPRGEGWLHGDQRVIAPRPDPGMLSEVRAYLEERRLLTAELFVLTARYRMVEVEASLAGAPRDPDAVVERLRDGLALYLDPLAGGAEGTGWPFGQPVRPSEIAHALQKLAGEDAAVGQVGVRLLDPAKPHEAYTNCVDAAIAPYELVALQALNLRWLPPPNDRGGLK